MVPIQVDSFDRQVGKKITYWRTLRNLTTTDLAQRANLTMEQLLEYENGSGIIPIPDIQRIAQALGLGLTQLLPRMYPNYDCDELSDPVHHSICQSYGDFLSNMHDGACELMWHRSKRHKRLYEQRNKLIDRFCPVLEGPVYAAYEEWEEASTYAEDIRSWYYWVSGMLAAVRQSLTSVNPADTPLEQLMGTVPHAMIERADRVADAYFDALCEKLTKSKTEAAVKCRTLREETREINDRYEFLHGYRWTMDMLIGVGHPAGRDVMEELFQTFQKDL